jgi:hypothetical protein
MDKHGLRTSSREQDNLSTESLHYPLRPASSLDAPRRTVKNIRPGSISRQFAPLIPKHESEVQNLGDAHSTAQEVNQLQQMFLCVLEHLHAWILRWIRFQNGARRG